VILCSVVASTGWAQGRPGVGPDRRRTLSIIPKTRLLEQGPVIEELKVTSTQKTELAKAVEKGKLDVNRFAQEVAAGLRDLGDQPDPQERLAFLTRVRSERESLASKTDAAILRVLNRPQRTRLDEIHLQAEGPIAFTRPELQERLNLGPDQVEEIMTIIAEGKVSMSRVSEIADDAMSRAVPVKPGEKPTIDQSQAAALKSAQEKARKESGLIRSSMNREISRVLTKKQRSNYQRMLGEPFDLGKPTTASSRPSGTNLEAKKP
jgi:hypothetical protein